jgi:hypothetical protein
MEKKYTPEEIWKIYEKLPEELKDAIFSEEAADNIFNICSRHGVKESRQISEVAKYVGRVLLGLLPPNELQETLEIEMKLEKEKAKKISQEVYRFIFYPVKASLEELYKIEIAPPAQPTKITPPPQESQKVREETKIKEEVEIKEEKDIYREKTEEEKKQSDIYREPIE